ncbi:MAG TPA: hypothetical protein VJU84_16830 [Pyrinomonadaceae bacterium]|nr:hypothetical protein [Pyrinomonadaceae bacterium]
MLKNFTRLFLYLTLFTVFGVIYSPYVAAQQPVGVFPTALYRFQISYWDGGHLLTHYFAEGSANGHTYDPLNHPFFDNMGIYRPPDGYTPDPSSGLVRLHRWRVVQGGWRVYYYYSIYYSEHGSDYHYEGVAGWVFSPGTGSSPGGAPLHALNIWYSTDLGFWYEFRIGDSPWESPPNRPGKANYVPLGRIAMLPPGCINPEYPSQVPPGEQCFGYVVMFNPPTPPPPPPPPPPPGSCTSGAGAVSKCSQLGGSWNYETCSCEY